jgi:uncharacterized protein YjbJ (UPF0337 family)
VAGQCEAQSAITAVAPHFFWDRIERNWKQLKGQVRQQWGSLTNDDLDVIEGKRAELSGRLQKRYGHRQGRSRAPDRCLAEYDSLAVGQRTAISSWPATG